MNCIFCCVFHQEKYLEMFYILLESILLYGKLKDDTHLLIYTTTYFMNRIIEHTFYDETKMFFECNDSYDTIDKACKARLDLFDLPSIQSYNKILYLDTDIIIKGDLNLVFDVCQEEILYVLKEGRIDDFLNDHGKVLFGNQIKLYEDKTAFTSGILLFPNCKKIKDLFHIIKEDIIRRPHNFVCCDQPYIIYNAFKYKLYNNTILGSLVVNNDNNIYSDKIIHHFPGGPGIYIHKIIKMNNYLKKLKQL